MRERKRKFFRKVFTWVTAHGEMGVNQYHPFDHQCYYKRKGAHG